mgnify:CR=1 FL=1
MNQSGMPAGHYVDQRLSALGAQRCTKFWNIVDGYGPCYKMVMLKVHVMGHLMDVPELATNDNRRAVVADCLMAWAQGKRYTEVVDQWFLESVRECDQVGIIFYPFISITTRANIKMLLRCTDISDEGRLINRLHQNITWYMARGDIVIDGDWQQQHERVSGFAEVVSTVLMEGSELPLKVLEGIRMQGMLCQKPDPSSGDEKTTGAEEPVWVPSSTALPPMSEDHMMRKSAYPVGVNDIIVEQLSAMYLERAKTVEDRNHRAQVLAEFNDARKHWSSGIGNLRQWLKQPEIPAKFTELWNDMLCANLVPT